MTLEQPHPIGTEIDRLCGGLERFGRAGYGQQIYPAQEVGDYPGNFSNNRGITYFFVAKKKGLLFVQDAGIREKFAYRETGKEGTYEDHVKFKKRYLEQSWDNWPGVGFGAYAYDLIKQQRRLYDDERRRIWTPFVERENYNHFLEVIVLPFGMWYREGAERESPAMEVILKPEYHRHSESFRNDFKATLKRFRALPKSKSIDKIKMRELRELLGK